MTKVDNSDRIASFQNELIDAISLEKNKKVSKKSESFLSKTVKSNFWQVSLTMDTEQACHLAVQHIDSKRQNITKEKLGQLKRLLTEYST